MDRSPSSRNALFTSGLLREPRYLFGDVFEASVWGEEQSCCLERGSLGRLEEKRNSPAQTIAQGLVRK